MPQPSHRRPSLLLMVLAALFVLVPFLFWRDTWFGRRLEPAEIERYLQDSRHPRKVQHALAQAADRMVQRDSTVKNSYPQILALARHPSPEIRSTAAWVMGQDNTSDAFHHSLLSLLQDPVLMVRRNAALALVRFQDPSGRAELLGVLQPYTARAAADGTVSIPVRQGQRVGSGSLLARIRTDQGGEVELRSPYTGEVAAIEARNESRVAAGERIVSMSPDPDQVWEALRALYGVGRAEDLETVQRYGRGLPNMPPRIREQAVLAAQAIRTRSERSPNP